MSKVLKEGQSIGIVLNLSLLTKVTRRIPTVLVKEIIENAYNFIFMDDYEGANTKPKVFVNGILMGFCTNSQEFLNELKTYRKSGLLDKQISFIFNEIDNEVRIFSDEGRFIRPVFTVNENNKLNITEKDGIIWDELIEKEHIIYIDNNEAETSVIAMDQTDLDKFKCNYCEIQPAMMMGVMSNGIPFSDHSQCIECHEPVYMFDGTTKQIKDVKIGDKVITFDPETQKQSFTEVTHTYTHETDKELFQIITSSGRKITATFDHRFMTSKGWERLEHLDVKNTLIGVSLEPKPLPNVIDVVYSILPSFPIELFDKKYMKHLLPLSNRSIFLPIISRLYGYIFFNDILKNDEDEYCFIVDFKHDNDIENFDNDIKLLGIHVNKVILCDKKILYDGVLAHLLYLLKIQTTYLTIPSWIMNGTQMVKREFVASVNYLQKRIPNIDLLFRDLGVNKDSMQYNMRVNQEYRFLDFALEKKDYDIVKYFNVVNFRYNYLQQLKIGMKVEYLKYVQYMTCENKYHTCVSFNIWQSNVQISNETLFIPIYSITKSEENIISDITVNSTNQSFLCGDLFCVHNSPRNIYQSSIKLPCRKQENLKSCNLLVKLISWRNTL